jgi:hypothetical protein
MPGVSAAESQGIRVHGKVVDFKTGEPLAKALVSIRSQQLDAVTDGSGQFELRGVQPGEVELYVSTVGYGLLKKKMQVSDLELRHRSTWAEPGSSGGFLGGSGEIQCLCSECLERAWRADFCHCRRPVRPVQLHPRPRMVSSNQPLARAGSED